MIPCFGVVGGTSWDKAGIGPLLGTLGTPRFPAFAFVAPIDSSSPDIQVPSRRASIFAPEDILCRPTPLACAATKLCHTRRAWPLAGRVLVFRVPN
jgi:hypothetical protein